MLYYVLMLTVKEGVYVYDCVCLFSCSFGFWLLAEKF